MVTNQNNDEVYIGISMIKLSVVFRIPSSEYSKFGRQNLELFPQKMRNKKWRTRNSNTYSWKNVAKDLGCQELKLLKISTFKGRLL